MNAESVEKVPGGVCFKNGGRQIEGLPGDRPSVVVQLPAQEFRNMSAGIICRRERLNPVHICRKARGKPFGHYTGAGLAEDENMIGIEQKIRKSRCPPQAVVQQSGRERIIGGMTLTQVTLSHQKRHVLRF
jgi:hypothetical protein